MGTRVLVAMVAMFIVMAFVAFGHAAGYPLMPGNDAGQAVIAAQTGDSVSQSFLSVGMFETYP